MQSRACCAASARGRRAPRQPVRLRSCAADFQSFVVSASGTHMSRSRRAGQRRTRQQIRRPAFESPTAGLEDVQGGHGTGRIFSTSRLKVAQSSQLLTTRTSGASGSHVRLDISDFTFRSSRPVPRPSFPPWSSTRSSSKRHARGAATVTVSFFVEPAETETSFRYSGGVDDVPR